MTRIPRNHPFGTLVALLLLAATALIPAGAHGAPPPEDPPLITDPAGDAGLACNTLQNLGNLVANCGANVPQPAKPAVDIVSGDVSFDSTDLVFETTVVDLDDPSARPGDYAWYTMTAVTGNVQISFTAERRFGDSSSYATATVTSGTRTVNGVVGHELDLPGNTVRWTMGLPALNQLITHVCAECREVKRGTTLTGISARTRTMDFFLSYDTDVARASRNYTVGSD